MDADGIRGILRHENELINHRLTWLAGYQGLLLAAFAFAWDKAQVNGLLFVICITGALVAISTGIATLRANQAIDNTVKWWDEHKPADYSGLDVEGIRGSSGLWWLMPGRFIPWLFLVSWIITFLLSITRTPLPSVVS